MFRSALVLCAAAALAAPALAADEDIIWPVYALVSKSYDAKLSCPQLRAEIAYVERDIRLLARAQRRAEEAVHTINDTQSSMGREQGGAFLNTGTAKVAFDYIEARDQIKESRRVAQLRRDHLVEIQPNCKNGKPSTAP